MPLEVGVGRQGIVKHHIWGNAILRPVWLRFTPSCLSVLACFICCRDYADDHTETWNADC